MPSMSSAPVGQGLQPCLQPRQARLSKIKPQINGWVWSPPDNANEKEIVSSRRWSSIYSLRSKSRCPLDAMNFELCTETLGCETGVVYTLADLKNDEISMEKFCSGLEEERKHPVRESAVGSMRKRRNVPSEFPPPLTTLGGEGRLRLSRKRVEGRLLLIPFKPSLLVTERSNGRLLLRLLPCMGTEEKEVSKVGVEKQEEDLVGEDINEEDGEGEGGYLGVVGAEMNSNGEGETGIGKYRRAGRCKEEESSGSKAMLNSDAFWLTTS